MIRRHLQRGFGALMVVVLLVFFSLIGVYMSTQLTTSALGTALSFSGMQGHFAARSGMEWAFWQVLNSGCGAFGSFTVGGFTVDVTLCTANAVTEGPVNYTAYDLEVTAVRGVEGNADYVSRSLRAYVTDAP